MTDTIENIGPEPGLFRILYHTNFGFPAVGEGTRVLLNGRELMQHEPPGEDTQHRSAQAECYPSGTGHFLASLERPASGQWQGIRVNLEGDARTLPYVQLWSDPRPYRNIVSIEPVNCDRRSDGTSTDGMKLMPGEAWTSTLNAPENARIRNALQTNGMLLDEEWASFLKENSFLVGISIDGPQEIHDAFRYDKAGRASFKSVMRGYELLKAYGVEHNILTVVHRENAKRPLEVYHFLKEIGADFIQFIPIVERSADGKTLAGAPQIDEDGVQYEVTPWSVLPRNYGSFLTTIFDEWVTRDVGSVFLQFFDMQLGLFMGQPASLCVFAETCGQGLAMEHNGDLYACNGGCPKHRFLKTKSGEPGLNYFCRSTTQFVKHARPYLETMVKLLQAGRPASDIMSLVNSGQICGANRLKPASAPSRNAPCPCGSGRKFKHCCGA